MRLAFSCCPIEPHPSWNNCYDVCFFLFVSFVLFQLLCSEQEQRKFGAIVIEPMTAITCLPYLDACSTTSTGRQISNKVLAFVSLTHIFSSFVMFISSAFLKQWKKCCTWTAEKRRVTCSDGAKRWSCSGTRSWTSKPLSSFFRLSSHFGHPWFTTVPQMVCWSNNLSCRAHWSNSSFSNFCLLSYLLWSFFFHALLCWLCVLVHRLQSPHQGNSCIKSNLQSSSLFIPFWCTPF